MSEGVQWPSAESVTAAAPKHGAACIVYIDLQLSTLAAFACRFSRAPSELVQCVQLFVYVVVL